ncbi:NEGR1 regulator, partial [Alaudala cheleensis]|nr:NEGR1 regulator [Alaudala cheleensis]
RCYLEDGASKGAWLNRSSIIFAGSDKWSVDPRVSIATANRREYSLQIQDVDVTDDGPYTCSVQTQHTPRTMQVHLTVQAPRSLAADEETAAKSNHTALIGNATPSCEPSSHYTHLAQLLYPSDSHKSPGIGAAAQHSPTGGFSSSRGVTCLSRCQSPSHDSYFSVAPTIQELKSSGVVLGGNGLIRCEGAGVPAPVFEWFRGERK